MTRRNGDYSLGELDASLDSSSMPAVKAGERKLNIGTEPNVKVNSGEIAIS